MKPLNIIYIHSHDTGRYIQPYGYNVDTPNLQQLAEEGVLFRKAFCAGPTCSPSRAGLLTGQAPHCSGMLGLAHRGFRLNDYRQHLAYHLREAGYTTALSGVQHVAGFPTTDPLKVLPYDRFNYKHWADTTKTVQPAQDWAADFIKQEHHKPFFISVGFQETHREFQEEPDPQDDPRYLQPPTPLPDHPTTRKDFACYRSKARILDQKMGVVFQAVKDAGLEESTLVICTTDHGIPFPAMKCSLTDSGIGVMLIIKGPMGFTGGKVIDGMVSHIDIFPTICEMIEMEKPDYLQGLSIMPLVKGDAVEINEAIFSEVTYHAAYEPKRCIRTTRYKYIRRMGDDFPTMVLPNCDDSPSKTYWTNQQWGKANVPNEQLYDLEFDPNEMNNLTDSHETQEVLKQMRQRLEDWMQRTDDPLLKGPVSMPSGGLLTPQGAYSPSDSQKVP